MILLGLEGVISDPFWNRAAGGPFVVNHAVNSGAADAVGLGDLAEALSALTIYKDSFAVERQWFSSDLTAFEAGPPHAGADPFDDQRPFQLRDCADDDDDGAAQRAARVDLFAERYEFDSQSVQLVEH